MTDKANQRLAIVGSGISGMASAYFLQHEYDITLFEKNDYVGGHTNTISHQEGNKTVSFDTGFMVFNFETYPLLTKLFAHLGTPIKKTDMSFSVQNLNSGLEYSGSGFKGLFAQKKNLLSLKHWKFLQEIGKFNKLANEIADSNSPFSLSMGEFIKKYNFKHRAFEDYVIPMSSAVWSTPPEKMLEFPIYTLIRFFKNHGFLGMTGQHQWYTVVGGSKSYRDQLIQSFQDKITLKSGVTSVALTDDQKVAVTFTKDHGSNETQVFDKAILATHADQSLKILKSPTDLQKQILSSFTYQKNIATIHTDSRLMPKLKECWSSWNYRFKLNSENQYKPTTIYYMNKLQGVSDSCDYFVSINGEEDINPSSVIKTIIYEHPVFDLQSYQSWDLIPKLNSDGPLYFVGAWQRYGFHEDGLASAYHLSKSLLSSSQELLE